MERLKKAASKVYNPLDTIKFESDQSQLFQAQQEINSMRNKIINDKAKSVSLLELVQLPYSAISGKDHTFRIVKGGEKKEKKKPVKFTIISFNKDDYTQFRAKSYSRNYLNEAFQLFDDVNKISGNQTVSALISNKKLIKHQGDMGSQEFQALIGKALQRKLLPFKYRKKGGKILRIEQNKVVPVERLYRKRKCKRVKASARISIDGKKVNLRQECKGHKKVDWKSLQVLGQAALNPKINRYHESAGSDHELV